MSRAELDELIDRLNKERRELENHVEAITIALTQLEKLRNGEPGRTAARDGHVKNGTLEKNKLICGHRPTSIVRWMGHQQWKPQETAAVLKRYGIHLQASTIRTQLSWGRNKKMSLPQLSAKDAHGLNSARAELNC